MGFSHSPKIVTDGLVAYYDAKNIKSYPGSGTVWYDKSGNGYDLTLTNGPTWNSEGFFDNDSDSYFTGAGGSEIPTGNDPYTMFVWANQRGTWSPANGLISIGGYYTTNGSNALRTLGNNSVGHFHHYWWGNDLSLSNNNAGIGSDDWFMVAASFDGTSRYIWVNGVSRAGNNPTGHNVTSTTIQVSKTVTTEYQIGDMAVAGIYNRALTSDEQLQNYNALKGRFGL